MIRLLILLPLSGDSESTVQSNLIFEELLRMKPKYGAEIVEFVNPIKSRLDNGYGAQLVEQFLTVSLNHPESLQREPRLSVFFHDAQNNLARSSTTLPLRTSA